MKYPIVIPLHPAGGKFKDNSELRFALRSLEKNFKGEFEVAIVSTRLPDWIQGVRHIYGEGLKSSLHTAAKEYPDGFFWWYDDNCLLLPTDGETMKITPVAHRWSKPSTAWRKQLEKVRVRLLHEKLPCQDFSSPHGPYWFDLAMVEEAFADWPKMSGKFPMESWILSKRNWPTVRGQTSQYYGRLKTPPGPQHRYLNYNDKGNTKEIRRFLDGTFRISTRFEKPDPEFMSSPFVRGVVINLPNRPRWEDALIESMGAIGIAVDRFDGTDSHTGDVPAMEVNWRLFEREFKRVPLAGEIGCYSSHIKIAKSRDTLPALCDEFPNWHLVLEDDAIPRNMTSAKMVAIARMAVEFGYDLVFLNVGKDQRRMNRPMGISPTNRKDSGSYAYIANDKAMAEMSGWVMRHPLDLAISGANRIRIGGLCGKHRFDHRRHADSAFSIHWEKRGQDPAAVASSLSHSSKEEIEEFHNAINPWASSSVENGTDKTTKHGYGEMYSRLLGPLRGRPISLLEIGVKTGASLKAWKSYLGDAASITGVDIDLGKLKYDDLDVVLADATTLAFSEAVDDESLDVIIDDGSHQPMDQIFAFRNLCKKLKDGGVYIIEDICNEKEFRRLAADTNFSFFDTRPRFSSDDLCAVFVNDKAPKLSVPANPQHIEVHTLRFGNPDWLGPCKARFENWIQRNGLDLKVWDESNTPTWYPNAKFCLIEMLQLFLSGSSEWFFYVDADVFVDKNAPVPLFSQSGVYVAKDCPWSGVKEWPNFCKKHFGETADGWCYRNAGVWACDRKSAAKLLEIAVPPYIDSTMEQDQLNWWWSQMQAEGTDIHFLDQKWNVFPQIPTVGWFIHPAGGKKLDKISDLMAAGFVK